MPSVKPSKDDARRVDALDPEKIEWAILVALRLLVPQADLVIPLEPHANRQRGWRDESPAHRLLSPSARFR
jgi:uncharacterized protein (DUF2236 family)